MLSPRLPLVLLLAAAPALPLLAAEETAPPAPLLPLPNAAQMRWHKAEYIMFAHYGMKTFHPSGNHMGSGDEDPKTYAPSKFDANQWVEAAKAGGFKGIVLTTKHHDGFCNWRTDTTDHCVKKAAWKNGEGDAVRDLTEACKKGGVYFGLYVSILDVHFNKYGAPGYKTYGDFYFDQLKELSTRYGTVDEYWFDGFNATDNKLKVDYPKIAAMIAKEQPEAVIYDSGMLVKSLPDRCVAWPGHHGGLAPDQQYVRKVDGVDRWYPNEASIVLQGNWFHTGAPSVGVRSMQDLYLASTGVGSTPLMNIPPNKDGLIDEDTVAKLKVFKAWVDGLHANNLAKEEGVKATDAGHRGNDPKYAAGKALDGDYDTYFATDDGQKTATLEVALAGPRKIGGFLIQEYIPLGQRIEGYTLECRVDGKWKPVFAGKTIGYKRIILDGRSQAPALAFNEGNIDIKKLEAKGGGKKGGDGAPLKLPVADAVRLTVTDAKACPLINNFQVIYDDSPRVIEASSEVKGAEAQKAIDGDPGTLWHTHGPDGESGLPQHFTVDLGKAKTLKGFTYAPRTGTPRGVVDRYRFETSQDGKAWTTASEGEIKDLATDTTPRKIPFKATPARFFRFTGLHVLAGNHVAVGEIGVIE